MDPNKTVKKVLGSIVHNAQARKDVERATKDAEIRVLREERFQAIGGIGKDVATALAPYMEEMLRNSHLDIDELKAAFADAVVAGVPDINVNVPDVNIPPIHVPQPNVTVNVDNKEVVKAIGMMQKAVSEQLTPFADQRAVHLEGVDFKHPIPVILTDNDGKPYIAGSMGGGNGGSTIIKDTAGNSASITKLQSGKGLLNVAIVDSSGNQVDSFGGSIASVSITDIFGTTGTDVVNPDGRIKVELPTGSSGLTDTELRASSVPVSQVSGSSWSTEVYQTVSSNLKAQTQGIEAHDASITVNPILVGGVASAAAPSAVSADGDLVRPWHLRNGAQAVNLTAAGALIPGDATDGLLINLGLNNDVVVSTIFGSTAANVVNPDGRLKVELPSGASGLTDTELRATPVPVSGTVTGITNSLQAALIDSSGIQYSGSNPFTVNVNNLYGTTGTNPFNTDSILQVSIANVFGTTGATGVYNADNRLRVELPATTITGITNSVAAVIVDGTGVSYTGSNPIPVTSVSGVLTSTVAVGDVPSDTADTGSAPIKIGGIARTANPTAVAANDRVSATFDDVGRQITRPIQVRDLIATAYATVSNGTETTLLAATAGELHDLLYVMGANTSDAAVRVDIRQVLAGNVMMSLMIPASSTAGISLPIPIPQTDSGNAWTADMDDFTGTTVYMHGMFSKEV